MNETSIKNTWQYYVANLPVKPEDVPGIVQQVLYELANGASSETNRIFDESQSHNLPAQRPGNNFEGTHRRPTRRFVQGRLQHFNHPERSHQEQGILCQCKRRRTLTPGFPPARYLRLRGMGQGPETAESVDAGKSESPDRELHFRRPRTHSVLTGQSTTIQENPPDYEPERKPKH